VLARRRSSDGDVDHLPVEEWSNASHPNERGRALAARRHWSSPATPQRSYRTTARALEKAVIAAQATLASTGQDASRLDGFTWHGLRHTWASRLVMAGVDLRTLQQLGGWRTLMMVERYSHLSPDHLRAAMETLVVTSADPGTRSGAAKLERNLNDSLRRRNASIQNGAEVCDSTSTEG
jgi:hypothetical protein